MRIQSMFQKDIDRDINGVIKISEKSEEIAEQELSEYVVTRELAEHFGNFYAAYERAIERPTDKVGVWISGFFGSGKSHFLTMLSHLLTNKEVAGKHALDYFADKFPSRELYERAQRCASIPTEAILFNIDNKNVGGQDRDALKRTFARVFYDHLGFYGEDLKLARLEQFVDKCGKTQEFRTRYEELAGEAWTESRDTYAFNTDEVIGALVDTGVMSEPEAERYLDGADQVDFSIDALTTEIADYARKRTAEEGGAFRLLFMVDEVGQYVNNGKDVSRMLNLQTIVEELGSKGQGTVWVMVTSQEAIDEVVKMAGTSVDFSKIQGRFTTRLSLSGINADEVIKRRILEKTQDAADLLRMEYGQKAAALKNLFHFKNAVEDLGGYSDADDFVATYPFVNYQFKLMQKSLDELRKHGSSGKSTSGNERSMLSGFQEATQAIEDRDETALIPFWRFYDTIQTFLEGHVRRVVNRADEAARNRQGLEPFDVSVLKLLFLIRWVNDVEANPENIAILMVENTEANLLELRRAVNESLARLVKQNYAGRSGEVYQFLTDDEREIAHAISNTVVNPADITSHIGQIVFGQIFDSNKLRIGENDFDVEKYIDETRIGAPGGMVLRVMTAAAGEELTSREALLMRSQRDEAICLLSDDTRYYDLIQDALRVEIYARTNNIGRQPENVQRIIRDRRQDAHAELDEAHRLLEEGIRKGEFYAVGSPVKPQGTTAKQMLISLLGNSVESIYSKLDFIDTNYHSDAEILEILRGQCPALEGLQPNERAVEAMKRFLENQNNLGADTPMSAVQQHFQARPFGWREIDIAAVAAELLAAGDARLRYAGSTVDITTPAAVSKLRKATETRQTLISLRVRVADHVRRAARDITMHATGKSNLPLEEAELAAACYEALSERLHKLEELLHTEYRSGSTYPGREDVEHGIVLLRGVLSAGRDASDLLPSIVSSKNDLEDTAEDLEDVFKFFPDQQRIWDRAASLRRNMERERDYLSSDRNATDALATITSVLDSRTPYGRIRLLADAMQTVNSAYGEMLKAKQQALLDRVEEMYADIDAYAQAHSVNLPQIAETKLRRRNTAHDSTSLSELDALSTRLSNDQASFYARIDEEAERRKRPLTPPVTPGKTPAQPAPHIKRVERSLIFRPETLRTEQDIDRYLAAVRTKLLSNLDGADGIRIQ